MGSISKFIERLRYYCEVASVGYDWGRRNNLWDGGDTDCSALTIGCLNEAGFDTGDAVTTHNLASNLMARGWESLPPNISDARPGDILLNDANHVATVVEGYGWNALIAQASIGETGGVYGNQPGDQTGWETNVSPIYDYPWDRILRWTGEDDYEGDDDMVPSDVWEYNYEGTAPGGNMYNCVLEMHAQLAALTAAVDALAKSKGANPKTIANVVDKAVRDKLASIKVSVK